MKNWKEILITPRTLILEAIEILDKGAMQIALVVDERRRLLGTVTDGDVRRGILKGISLNDSVKQIMNPSPVIASISEPREHILFTMKQKQLRHIPILNEDGCLISLETLEELVRPLERENWAVIMAGGLGTRLRPLTDELPKPLLKVGGKPILETILENMIEYGFKRIYLSVNYKAEMVEEYFGDGSRWNIEIKYIYENQRLGTAGALALLPEKPTHPLLVMNGDLLTKINFKHLIDFHQEHQAEATMCVRDYGFQIPYGVVNVDQHRLNSIDEKPMHHFFVNAGIYVLEPTALDFIPKSDMYDMTALFEKLMEHNLETAAFPIREYWMDIGQKADYEKANMDFIEVFG